MKRRLTSPYVSLAVACIALFAALGGNSSAAVATFLTETTNTASAKTTLSAPIADKALQLSNTSTGSGATALGLSVASGHAPFTTNSPTKVASLNADMVDGYHATSFARVVSSTPQNFWPSGTFSSQATVSIAVPRAGFVLLHGAVGADEYNPACNPCYVDLRFHNVNAAADSPATLGSVGDGTSTERATALVGSFVWPVVAGTYTFTLDTTSVGGSVAFLNPSLTAIFIPFNGTGGTSAPVPAALSKPASRTATASGTQAAP